jgi:hypothetical protein
MDDITIKAGNALEREISFSPDEALKFLKKKENFRFVSNGIKRELARLGITGDDETLLAEFKNLMETKNLMSDRGRAETNWWTDAVLPNKSSAIKLCFAFGLSSKTKPTALEFLWNVCRINGFNYRIAEDIAYHYALERGESYEYANTIIAEYEATTASVNYTHGDETKGTSTMWATFANLADMERDEFLELLCDNKKNFIEYNKTAHREFVTLYNELVGVIAEEIKFSNIAAMSAKLDIYKPNDGREAEVHAEIIYEGFIRALLGDDEFTYADVPEIKNGTVISNIMHKFPLQSHMDIMSSNEKRNRAKATDLGHGFARKTFVLCFFANYVLKWVKKRDKDNKTAPVNFYHDFYYSLELLLHKCSYGLLYPANPFDWLILNCVRSLDSADQFKDMNPIELFNETLVLLGEETL